MVHAAHNDHRQAVDAPTSNASDSSAAVQPYSIFCETAYEISKSKQRSMQNPKYFNILTICVDKLTTHKEATRTTFLPRQSDKRELMIWKLVFATRNAVPAQVIEDAALSSAPTSGRIVLTDVASTKERKSAACSPMNTISNLLGGSWHDWSWIAIAAVQRTGTGP